MQGLQNVSVMCSTNGGNTFTIPVNSATGDIGTNIMPGGPKQIIWNVLNNIQALPLSQGTALQGFTINFDGIQMDVYDIKPGGKTIKSLFKLTSETSDQDANLHQRNLRMIDNTGNVYEKDTSVTLGSQTNKYQVRQNLVSGIPLKGELIYNNTQQNTKNITVLEIR